MHCFSLTRESRLNLSPDSNHLSPDRKVNAKSNQFHVKLSTGSYWELQPLPAIIIVVMAVSRDTLYFVFTGRTSQHKSQITFQNAPNLLKKLKNQSVSQ